MVVLSAHLLSTNGQKYLRMPITSAPRLAWIDLLRGLSVVGMIATHVINAILDARFDGSRWLHELTYFDGLIAPMFLWIAGYAQGLAIQKALISGKPVLNASRLRRLGLIAVIAYALHLPWGLWIKGDFGEESWRILFQADILQCMAVSLFALGFIGHFARRRSTPIIILLALCAVFMAPMAKHWQTGFLPIDAFLNRNTGSLFPLFPWFGFAACGCLASYWPCEIYQRKLIGTAAGIVMILTSSHFTSTPWTSDHPYFFFERLGWLLVIVIAAQLIARCFAPRWIMLASRESLLLYVVHLLLIYALPIHGQPLNLWLGRTQSLPVTLLWFLFVLAVSLLMAWTNDRRKQRLTAPPASV